MASNAVIGALRITLGADTAQFEAALSGFRGRLKGAEKQMRQIGKRMAAVGAGMSAGITAPLTAFANASFKAFTDQEDAIAGMEAALKSMGGAAGFSSQQLQSMASELQAASTFGDEDILSKVTANLLTFGNVQGDVFARAQQNALDLSARLGRDLQSSAIMLGKALNDPIIGLSALSEAGVSFTEEQKEMIKQMAAAGDVAGAQSLILAELEKQYSGQARAMAETTSGSLSQLNNAWSDFREEIGAIVAEFLPPLVEGLRSVVKWLEGLDEGTVKMSVGFGAFAAALGPVVVVVGALVAAIGAIGLPVAAVIAGVAALGAAWVAYGDDITAIVTDTYGTVSTAIGDLTGVLVGFGNDMASIAENTYTAIKTWLLDKLEAVWAGLKAGIDSVTGFFSDMYDAVVGNSFVPDMVLGVESWFARMGDSMTQSAEGATASTNNAFDGMLTGMAQSLRQGEGVFDNFTKALDRMANRLIDQALAPLENALGNMFAGGLATPNNIIIGSGGGGIGSLFSGLMSGIGGLFAGGFADGGTIPPGRFGLVGEAGPEFAVAGSRPLNIEPLRRSRGGQQPERPVIINFNVTSPDAPSFRRSEAQITGMLARAVDRGRRGQ